MSGHESLIVIGKLSRDPELKYNAAGTAVARFSIPVDRKVGEERKTVWWNITTFNKTAESVGQNLHKGSLVRAEGVLGVDKDSMTPRLYEKDGSSHSVCEMIANQLTYLDNFGAGKKEESGEARSTQAEFPF